jgi:RNA polymerase sigma-70 factor (ECF subfamily)
MDASALASWPHVVRGALADGAVAWPIVHTDPCAFERWALSRDVGVAQLAAHGADLVLAYACAEGELAAMALFEKRFLSRLDLRGAVQLTRDEIQEVTQRLRVRLLVGAPGKIDLYRGHAPLRAWVRTCAVRVALKVKRNRLGLAKDTGAVIENLTPVDATPELLSVRAQHRELVQRTIEECFDALSERDKVLLRMRFLDDLSIDQIGVTHGVHRATVARWLQSIREGLLDNLCKRTAQSLRVDPSEVLSLVRLVRPELDVDLEQILGRP